MLSLTYRLHWTPTALRPIFDKRIIRSKKHLACSYDLFSVNCYHNRVIKTTLDILLHANLSGALKRRIRKLLIYFDGVEVMDPHTIQWHQRYNRNNQTCQMLISVCYLVIKGLLQTTADGSTRLMDFLDEQRMCRLYEKFILEYYRRHYPQIETNASKIAWALDDDSSALLPVMQSDIMLTYGKKTLIIDAKYYDHILQTQYLVQKLHPQKLHQQKLHPHNLYQIFAYVKNKAADTDGDVAGMLLYAGTDEPIQPDCTYRMSGNSISVKTLDLNRDFSEIAAQLNAIAERFMLS